jgi:preprotein translocase subunit SecD
MRVAGMIAMLVASVLYTGCSSGEQNVTLEVRLVEETPAENLTAMTMRVWGEQLTYYAHEEVLMDERDVTAAMVITKEDGAPAIKLVFTGEGRNKLRRITERNLGGHLGIVIGGQLQCASPIEAANESGVLIVTGHMLERAARRCSEALTRSAARRSSPGDPRGSADGDRRNPPA